jgi:hypothetical protein
MDIVFEGDKEKMFNLFGSTLDWGNVNIGKSEIFHA